MKTTIGDVDPATLRKVTGTVEYPQNFEDFTEWYADGKLVRRDVHIRIKRGVLSSGREGKANG